MQIWSELWVPLLWARSLSRSFSLALSMRSLAFSVCVFVLCDVSVTVIDADFLTVWMSKTNRWTEHTESVCVGQEGMLLYIQWGWWSGWGLPYTTLLCLSLVYSYLKWQLWLVLWQFRDLNSIMTCRWFRDQSRDFMKTDKSWLLQ